MRRRLAAVAALVAVVAAVGCSQDSSSSSTTTEFGGNVTRPTAPVSTVADTAGLARFVPRVEGLTLVPAGGAETGPFDLNGAVLKYNNNDAEARSRLTTGGFAGGYAASFRGARDESFGVQLYQFKDQASAQDFADYLKEHAMQGVEAFDVTVPGIPGMVGFVQRQSARGQPGAQGGQGGQGGSVGGALFVKGPYLAYVGASSQTADVSGILKALTEAQYKSLP